MTPRALFHPARLARRPVLSTQSDERLVDLVRAGSDPAFEAIVERYRRALMRHVSRLLPAERAEDVVQQAFVNAYEAMHRGAAELNLRPWLYRIAHNVALNALRDRALGHAQLDEQIDGVERPDQAFERVTGLRELVVAVQALPERQRSAILLRELEGRSYEEIGAALGVTDGAVRQLLNRARNTLRAAAAAITPMPLLTRVASGESADSLSARVGELVGVGGGALAMKVCATALVTGAVVGGVAVVPGSGRNDHSVAPLAAETAQAADDSGHDGPSLTMRASAGNAGTRADVAEHGERHAAERSSRRGSAPGEPGDERRGGSRESGDDDGGDDGSSDDGERHRREGGSGGGGDGSSGDDSLDDPSGSGSDGPELGDGGGSSGPGGGTDLSEPDELDTADEHSTLAPETEPSGSDDTVPEPEPLDSSGPG